MKCNEARELISPWIDKEINDAERAALLAHLDSCPECRRELAEMENVTGLLRTSLAEAAEARTAPPGLAQAVMQTLREEARPKTLARWKQALAGIAAALALYLGASGLLATPLWQMAEKEPPISKDPVELSSKQPQAINTGENTPDASRVNTPGEQGKADNVASPSVTNEPGAKNPPPVSGGADMPKIAGGNNEESPNAPVFLSKERAVVSTLLKVKVPGQDEAGQQAIKLAEAAGATAQPLGEQMDGDRECLVLKISVPAEKAAALKANLAALGSEINRQEDRQDLTSRYAEGLEEYRVLSSRIIALQDKVQIKELEAQIKALENQLKNWDTEAARETIVLWLEV